MQLPRSHFLRRPRMRRRGSYSWGRERPGIFARSPLADFAGRSILWRTREKFTHRSIGSRPTIDVFYPLDVVWQWEGQSRFVRWEGGRCERERRVEKRLRERTPRNFHEELSGRLCSQVDPLGNREKVCQPFCPSVSNHQCNLYIVYGRILSVRWRITL